MPKFSYQAINPQGEKIDGTIDASNAEAVQNILSNQGSIPLSVSSLKEKSISSSSLETFLAKKVTTPEIIIFTKQLRTMLRSGIPILSIFSILAEQSENDSLKKALAGMEKEVHEGATMTSVFQNNPHIFSRLYCGLINAGEISGTMPEILDRVTFILEHEYKVKRDIKAALAYPKLVIITLFGAFFFLLTFVIPQFVSVFNKAGLELPVPTKICLWLYSMLSGYWFIMLAAVIISFLSIKMYCATKNGEINKDLLLINLPIVGPLFVKSAMSRFSSILAILLASGVNVLESFEILVDTIGNAAIANEFSAISEQLEEGRGISEPLRSAKLFPPMVVNMVSIGEESGSLEDMLREVASHYDEEVDYAVAGLAEAIGPLLIVVLTIVVGFFALAIFLPMWDMAKMV